LKGWLEHIQSFVAFAQTGKQINILIIATIR